MSRECLSFADHLPQLGLTRTHPRAASLFTQVRTSLFRSTDGLFSGSGHESELCCTSIFVAWI